MSLVSWRRDAKREARFVFREDKRFDEIDREILRMSRLSATGTAAGAIARQLRSDCAQD